MFPSVQVIRKTNSTDYVGLRLNFLDDKPTDLETFESEATKFGFLKMNGTDVSLRYCIFTGYQVNGNEVTKVITLSPDGTWGLNIRGVQVDPLLCGLNHLKADSMFSIKTILNTVKQITICKGKIIQTKKDTNKNSKIQEWTESGNENSLTLRASSRKCHGATSFTGQGEICTNCQNQKFTKISKLPAEESQDTETLIHKLFPGASDLMVNFMKTQSNFCQDISDNKDSRSRRWDKSIIQIALTLWNRSPQGYTTLRDSNMLYLPSESLLQRYKNCFTQHPGLNDNMIIWMHNESKRLKTDRHGGLILDEMAIQEDLKMSFSDGKVAIDGLVDLGSTADHLHMLNTHNNDIRLATHVLQFIFLGYDGFRFPFSYYPTIGANAPEIYITLWDAIAKLTSFEFHVDYVLFDGASNNRAVQMSHFKDKTEAAEMKFTTANPFRPTEKVSMVMDYSHNIKKWRNNIHASGDSDFSTRKLKHFENFIMWDFWIKAYNWDRIHNSVRVHPKLTDEHIFLTKTSKMRNRLAEDVLDVEMLNLMKAYQRNLKNGKYLDGAISMLEQTSVLIKIFRDPRTISDIKDSRLADLLRVEEWLKTWEDNINAIDNISASDKAKMFMSRETVSDVYSMIQGFTEVCKRRITHQKRSLVPAGFNSDVVENFFCQQRTVCHGSNSNPSVYQYKYGITATILGQNAVSKKANAVSKRKRTIQPYCFTTPVTLSKKKCLRI